MNSPGGGAAAIHDRIPGGADLSPADARLAHELMLGVLRRRLTLDHLSRHFFEGDWQRLDMRLRIVLALGIFQLAFLERIPDFAAVNESVELGKRIGGRKAGGLVNAVLRAFVAARGERRDRPTDASPRCWLEVDDGRGFLFSDELWPDPAEDTVNYLALTTSHPPWIVARWLGQFGSATTQRICRMGTQRPPLVVRANRMRIEPAALVERFAERGIAAVMDADYAAIELRDAGPPAESAEFREGLFQPQDATSQQVWRALPPGPGDCVVDFCAGVGTKATQAAEMMRDRGTVIASDVDVHKLTALRENAERLGLKSIRVVKAAGVAGIVRGLEEPPTSVLVDAPCSNSGVFARRPEARYRLNAARLAALADKQRELLDRAARLAGPATRLIYSTCSIECEENEQIVTAFCRQRPDWELVSSRLTLPDAGGSGRIWRDGGFVAVLGRRG